jgi:hypothetical protein
MSEDKRISAFALPPNVTNATISFAGLPAQPEHLHVINRFKGDDSRNAIPISGAEGEYKVVFVLARPGSQVFPTSRGFLGKIESAPFRAKNRSDAEAKAYRALASSLSNWSIHLDVPLHVYQIDTVEMATGNTQMSLVTPFWEAPLAITPTADMKPEFRGYASLYREALSSSSTVYRFLCLFKIIEGVVSRRARIAEEAKASEREIPRHREVLPPHERRGRRLAERDLPNTQDLGRYGIGIRRAVRVRGRRLGHVTSAILQPLRVNVAHALSAKSGELTMSVDELLHIQKINKWLLPTKCIVRRMLKNEFPKEFLPYLHEDGTILS